MTPNNNSHNRIIGFTRIQIAILILIPIAAIIMGYYFFHQGDQTNIGISNLTSTSSPTANNTKVSSTGLYTILSPATVPPKLSECNQQITFYSNGDSGPIKCPDGDLNILEWDSLSTLEPQVMALGYNATFNEVRTALCNDVHANIKNVIEETNYQISVLYYGWNFSSNPSTVLTNGTCINVDD